MSLPLLKNTEETSLGAQVVEGNAPSLQDPPKPAATASSDVGNSQSREQRYNTVQDKTACTTKQFQLG